MALLKPVEGVPPYEKVFDASAGTAEDRAKLVTAEKFLPTQLAAKEAQEKALADENAALKLQVAALLAAQGKAAETGVAQPLPLSTDEEKDLSSFGKRKSK